MPSGHDPPRSMGRPEVEPDIRCALRALFLVMTGLMIAPILVLAQTGPLRGQGQLDSAVSTSTAQGGRLSSDAGEADSRTPPPGDEGASPRMQIPGAGAQPSRRPRPNSAPVVLAPTAVTVPATEPAPARGRGRARARVRELEPQERRPAAARVWPVAPGTYELSQPFGCVPQLLGYYPVISGCPATRPSFHNGLDLAATQGTPIYAVATGWVTVAGRDGTGTVANTRIVIEHDGANEGYATEYFHWIRSYVEPGDYVRAGELIAEVGSVGYSTGPHLHFSVVEYASNERIDPMDWLPASGSGGSYSNAEAEASRDGNQSSGAGGRIVVTDYVDPTPLPVQTAP